MFATRTLASCSRRQKEFDRKAEAKASRMMAAHSKTSATVAAIMKAKL